jgi:hypothetical protein
MLAPEGERVSGYRHAMSTRTVILTIDIGLPCRQHSIAKCFNALHVDNERVVTWGCCWQYSFAAGAVAECSVI